MSLLKKLIAKVKSGSSGPLTTDEIMLPVEGSSINPQGGPIGTGMSMAHRDQRQMLAGGGGVFNKIKEAWKARENSILRAEREGNIEDLKTSIVERENEIADRLLEIAEKNEKYSTLSAPRTPSSYVVSDEEHEKRNKSREKSLADEVLGTPGSVSPMVWIFGAIGRRGLKYETMPESEYKRLLNSAGSVAKEVQREIEMERRNPFQEGGMIEEQMGALMPEEATTHIMPDGTEMPGATHEEYIEEAQLPDEEMEEDYVEFIMAEALEPEEQQYLSDKLVEDDQLSIIFDKVIETASEFSGSGSVEGPGSTVSDSIPARLSDGEFVMTAKATDALGADTLEELMALAEQEADAGRQTKAIGGEIENRIDTAPAVTEEDPLKQKQKEWMGLADPRRSLFSS